MRVHNENIGQVNVRKKGIVDHWYEWWVSVVKNVRVALKMT